MGDTAHPFRFRCQRSGNCCARPEGAVRVTDSDIERLAAHLGLGVAAVRSRYVAASGDRLVDGLGPRCVFLADGRHASCTIYPARPDRCRSWPFWDEHRDPAALAAAARVCPGIALGALRAGANTQPDRSRPNPSHRIPAGPGTIPRARM